MAISVGVNGNIKGRGDVYDQWTAIQSKFESVDIFGIANDAYIRFDESSYPLNPSAQSSGVTENQYAPQISFNAAFNNKDIPPEGFDFFNRTVSFSPSIRNIKPIPLFDQNGTYDIVDSLFDSRARINVNIDGGAKPNQSAENLSEIMKSEANFLLQKYGKTSELKLEKYNLSTGTVGNYSLAATWSFDTSNKVIQGSNYDMVNTLKLK